MTSARTLQISTIIFTAFFILNANAATNNWILWRQINSAMMSSHQNKKSIAAFSTNDKCKAEMEKMISTNMTELKAERDGNSVLYKAGNITYSCVPEGESSDKNLFKNSKDGQNGQKHNGNPPGSKQSLHQEF